MPRKTERRKLRFEKLSDIVDDVEQLTKNGEPRAIGNWSPGQVLDHLAKSCHASIDGGTMKLPWWLQAMGRVIKRRVLRGPMPSGFKMPPAMSARLMPNETTTAAGLNELREAIARLKQTSQRGKHPLFGPLTREEWDQLHLRHAELHLSFLHPKNHSERVGADS